MRKICLLSCTLFLVNISLSAHADTSISLMKTDGYEIGLQISSYKYEEEVDGEFFMSNEGNKFGLVGNATNTIGYNSYLVTEFRIASGDVDYTGSGTKSGNFDRLWELRITGGQDYEREGYVISPYTGLGVRSLFNDLRGTTSTGAVGYRRDSEYWYLPVGVTHRFRISADSRISTNLEYDYLIRGAQKTYLSDADPGYDDLVNEQKDGYGLRLSSAHETSSLSVGLFYNYWNIADSESETTIYYGIPTGTGTEPKNETNEFGVQILCRF
ncbi:MAG: hypothetical protein ABIJ24_05655 [Nitrospinota bacterium]|nr:hypothetical protein [Nitrospinota bacterium]